MSILDKIIEYVSGANTASLALSADGKGGPKTVKAMQKYFGVAQDGVISGQNKALKKHYPALTAVKYGSGGSLTIKKMQKWLGIKQDGIIGEKTVKALQKKLGVKQDGVWGSATMKAWQKYLAANVPDEPAASTKGAKIASMASAYAWPYGTASSKYSYSKGSAEPAYKTALKKYMGKTAKISQSDCGYFVSTCVRAAGISSSFIALKGRKQSFPKVPGSMYIVHKGKKIPAGLLQPGDIIRYKKTSGQHTLMYFGDGKIAEGQRESNFPAIKKDTKKYNKSNVKKSTIQVIRAK
jgi:peptidoglycan hydrolase-like protein with peptidoglycan-binding domain